MRLTRQHEQISRDDAGSRLRYARDRDGGRPTVLALTLAGEFVAHAIGANVVIVAIGVPLGVVAWRSGIRMTATAIAVIGLISETLVLQEPGSGLRW